MKKIILSLLVMICFVLVRPLAVSAYYFQEKPVKIVIPSLNISLPVKETQIEFDTWQVRLDGASYAENSTLPGNSGNTIIFSHALDYLFGRLPQVKTGDIIYVFTESDWFSYRVDQVEVVNPDQIDRLNVFQGSQLTLFTCFGDNYSQRFLVKASLVDNMSHFLPPVSLEH